MSRTKDNWTRSSKKDFRIANLTFLRGRHNFLFVVIAIMVSLSFQASAQERQKIDLSDKISVEEVNRILDEKTAQAPGEKVFYFGFDLRSGPLEDAREYLPFLSYLSRVTGYDFKLRFTPKDAAIADALGLGDVDFAAIGAVSFVLAREKYGVISLVRGVNSLGKSEYRSAIVVSPQSTLHDVLDLKGKRFAFGSASSTQGHLIPRITLEEHGINLADLAAYDYTGSHYNCANAIIKGAFDACGMQDTMAMTMASGGLIKILHMSGYYPSSGIAANRDIPTVVLEKVKQALLDFDPNGADKDLLYNWHKTEMPNGFQASRSIDYVDLRNWLIQLNMLKVASVSPVSGVSK